MATRRKKETSRPGRLRIVAGNWRSRLLEIADAPGLRPTSERIRETLFNWLSAKVYGAHCLDLFAGTGALGLEALSRGARSAVFVENSASAVQTLRANIAALGAEGAVVMQADAGNFLGSEHAGPFDIVFLDPPFAAGGVAEWCRLLDDRSALARDALVYIEQDRAHSEPELPASWRVLKNKTAGNVRYMLVQPGAQQD
ncbi:MAG: 16S rRNA (guanine(966)-N(2))-methyltransferase RsmD [Woeseiaceae bacterium]|nr:16S rRNA (guanine(966)-N(2))-methyltransferase RsmD [Woeseiaceae bacterium]